MASTLNATKSTGGNPSRVPQYAIKEVSEMMNISAHALRYYDNLNLFPYLQRGENGERLFSEFDLGWVRIVHCLRSTGLPVAEVQRYIKLCLEGDSSIEERAGIIFSQEENLREKIRELQDQFEILQKKKTYYQALLENRVLYDACNPTTKKG